MSNNYPGTNKKAHQASQQPPVDTQGSHAGREASRGQAFPRTHISTSWRHNPKLKQESKNVDCGGNTKTPKYHSPGLFCTSDLQITPIRTRSVQVIRGRVWDRLCSEVKFVHNQAATSVHGRERDTTACCNVLGISSSPQSRSQRTDGSKTFYPAINFLQ